MKTRSKTNKNNKTKKMNRYSWKSLQKTNCSFVNKIKVNKHNVKLKKIALEEAITWPEQANDVNEKSPLEYLIKSGKGYDKTNKLLEITGIRLNEMNENNIQYQILSYTATGIQGLKYMTNNTNGPNCQVKKAIEANNYMYNKIKENPTRFKAFATLPMSSPKYAAKELERCVKDLGMVGVLLNGNDVIYRKGKKLLNKMLFYDTPDYDVFWQKLVDLDVPLYIHPRVYGSPSESVPDKYLSMFYGEYPQLPGSAWGFSIYLAQHILRLILSGVFDRFPKLKLILGHLGEILPWWADRFDHRLCIYKNELNQINKNVLKNDKLKDFKLPKLTLREYLKQNIYVTTSGWFSDSALKYVIDVMGIDRVLFSIDYPYEEQKIASDWIDNLDLPLEQKEKIAYKNAAKLLKIKM